MFNVLVAVFVIANTKTSIYQYMYFLYPCLKNREKKADSLWNFCGFFLCYRYLFQIYFKGLNILSVTLSSSVITSAVPLNSPLKTSSLP